MSSSFCLNIHNVSVDASFRCFMSYAGANKELRTEPFTQYTGVVCANYVNNNRVQVLSYCK